MSALRRVLKSAIKSKKSKNNVETSSLAHSSLDDSFDTTPETAPALGNTTEGLDEPRGFPWSSGDEAFSAPILPSIPTVSESRSDLEAHEYYTHPTIIASARSPPQDANNNNIHIFQMQMELVQLRERIKLLDNGNGESQSELLDLINERDEEISQLHATVGSLKSKLNEINDALGQVTDEHHSLRECVSKLELEKQSLARHLHIREQEVVTLVKRLAGEEERLKEGALLRSKNQSLIKELEDFKSKIDHDNEIRLENKNLKDEVLREKNEKDDLQAELSHVRSKLHECQTEYERQLDKINEASNVQNLRVKELTEILRERNIQIASLKSASEQTKRDYESKLNEEKCNYGRKKIEFNSALTKIKNDWDHDNEMLKIKLQEKEEIIAFQSKKESDLKDQLDTQTKEAEQNAVLLKDQNSELRSLLGELSLKADQQLKELEECKQQMDECSKSNSSLLSELEKMADLASHQEQTLLHSETTFAAEISAVQVEFQTRESEIILNHNQLVATLKREMEERIEKMNIEVYSKDQLIISLEDRTMCQNKQIEELESQLQSLKVDSGKNILELQLRHENLTDEYSKLNMERNETIRSLSNELERNSKEKNLLLEKVKLLECTLLALEEQKSGLQNIISEKESTMRLHAGKLENDIADLNREVIELKKKLKKCQEQELSLLTNDSIKSDKLLEMQQQLDKLMESHASDITLYEQKIALQRDEMLNLDTVIKAAKEKEEEKSLQLEQCLHRNSALEEEVSKLNERIFQLEERSLMISELEENVIKLQDSLKLLNDQNRKLDAEKENAIMQSRTKSESLIKGYEALQSSMADSLCQAEKDKLSAINSLSDEIHLKEELIKSLRENITVKEEEVRSLKNNIAEHIRTAKEAQNELEKLRNLLNIQRAKLEAEKDAAIVQTRKEAESLQKENEKLKSLIKDVEWRAEQEKSDVTYYKEQLQLKESTIASLCTTNAKQEEVINSLHDDITRRKRESNSAAAESKKNLEKIETHLKNKLLELEAEKKAYAQLRKENEFLVQENEKINTSMAGALRQVEEQKDDAISSLRDQLHFKESVISSLHDSVSKQDGVIKSLKGDIEKLKLDAKQYASAAKDKLERMQKVRRTLEDQLRTHEKENTALTKMLEHSIKERSSLEAKILSLNESVRVTELNSAEIVADIEEKTERLQDQLENLERSSNKEKESLAVMVTELQSKLEELYAQKTSIEAKLREEILLLKTNHKSEMLESEEKHAEMKSTISTLLERRSSQEQNLAAVRLELEKEKKDHRESVEHLSAEAKRWQNKVEELSSAHSTELEGMQHMHATLKVKIQAQQDEIEHLQATLNDRTKLLGDMVAQNKATNSDLFDARALVADLQEESERYLRAKSEAEFKTAFVEKAKTEVEERLVCSLQQERSKRQNLEVELLRLRDVLENRKSDGKFLVTLERENAILKDKVMRQEQYLKRKLKQEKLLKERLAVFGGGKLSIETCGSQSWDLGED